jgi:vancomycin resistance protein YoaR
LGDGGGVCQVGTTLFRSVLNAGLKITPRLPHSYRVSYYELDRKPGVDATVYAGDTDFRFINDTPEHILIHAESDSKNLYMSVNIYGTSDGRTTELKDHITWNARPAPAPQYFPDPTLPVGKLVQIDWAASGISSSFINVIKDKNGKVIREDKYVSNYRPWSAKYLQGVAQ